VGRQVGSWRKSWVVIEAIAPRLRAIVSAHFLAG
jgi:hypothetical protein